MVLSLGWVPVTTAYNRLLSRVDFCGLQEREETPSSVNRIGWFVGVSDAAGRSIQSSMAAKLALSWHTHTSMGIFGRFQMLHSCVRSVVWEKSFTWLIELLLTAFLETNLLPIARSCCPAYKIPTRGRNHTAVQTVCTRFQNSVAIVQQKEIDPITNEYGITKVSWN